jgi:hypothetical protein
VSWSLSSPDKEFSKSLKYLDVSKRSVGLTHKDTLRWLLDYDTTNPLRPPLIRPKYISTKWVPLGP